MPEQMNMWTGMPHHFWTVVFFVFGSIVGSFLNVCIYRMPLGLSVVSPPSHCPHCRYSIPWILNIPLFTWLYLRGKCANCKSPVSPRYFAVELLTGLAFMSCWLSFGKFSPGVAIVYCLVLAGFIVATFIDFEHFIIPDEITLGGIAAGFLCTFAVPMLHNTTDRAVALKLCFFGILAGGGVVYGILRIGKLLFGRQKVELPANSTFVFTETALHLPDKTIPYEDIFYRKSDTIRFRAVKLELLDRCFKEVEVRLSPLKLQIGEDTFNPEEVPFMEASGNEMILPREAMGFGDVKFMAAIGAFLGWPAVLFSLMVSSILGAAVGILAIAIGKKEWSSRIPYGPYIAMAAVIWMFAGKMVLRAIFPPM